MYEVAYVLENNVFFVNVKPNQIINKEDKELKVKKNIKIISA